LGSANTVGGGEEAVSNVEAQVQQLAEAVDRLQHWGIGT